MRHLFFVLLVLMLVNCSSKEQTFTVEVIDGIQTVTNSGTVWGDESRLSLEFVRKIGGVDAVDENYTFYRVSDLAIDKESNIIVLDAGNHRVIRYSSNGLFLNTFGSEGQGPGELTQPSDIFLDDNGTIFITDIGNNRVQKFDSNGMDVGSFRMERRFSSINRSSKAEGFIVNSLLLPDSEDPSIKGSIMAEIDSDGGIIKDFGELHQNEDQRLIRYINDVNFDIGQDGSIFVVFNRENIIEKYSADGTLIFSSNRPLEYPVVHSTNLRSVTMGGTKREIAIPKLTFVSTGAAFDGQNRIWVTTLTSQPDEVPIKIQMVTGESKSLNDQNEDQQEEEEEEDDDEGMIFEIFNADGHLLGYHKLPEQAVLLGIFDDMMFLYNFEEASIVEYRIVEQ